MQAGCALDASDARRDAADFISSDRQVWRSNCKVWRSKAIKNKPRFYKFGENAGRSFGAYPGKFPLRFELYYLYPSPYGLTNRSKKTIIKNSNAQSPPKRFPSGLHGLSDIVNTSYAHLS